MHSYSSKQRIEYRNSAAIKGGGFLSQEFTQFLVNSGIQYDSTSPHTLEQNESAERGNRTLMECV